MQCCVCAKLNVATSSIFLVCTPEFLMSLVFRLDEITETHSTCVCVQHWHIVPQVRGSFENSEHSAALKTATRRAGQRVVTASSYVCSDRNRHKGQRDVCTDQCAILRALFWQKEVKTGMIYILTSLLLEHPLSDILITYKNKEIAYKSNTKFLGIYMTENLKWTIHLNTLRQKLCKVCYIIKSAQGILGSGMIKSLYHSKFESLVKYGIIFWGV